MKTRINLIMLAFCFFTALCIFSLGGCQKAPALTEYVCELKQALYYGENDGISLRAYYGFKLSDNTASNTPVYGLYFHLPNDNVDEVAKQVTLKKDDKIYKADFKLNPVTNMITAFIEIPSFCENQFLVTLNIGTSSTEILLSSIVPSGTLSVSQALYKLEQDHQNLISSYKNTDGKLELQIIMRLIVRNNKSYWYIGLKNATSVKAFLLDGITGETLAVREVF